MVGLQQFQYTYKGQTLTYTIIDYDAKTCITKAGISTKLGNSVEQNLIIPAKVIHYDDEFTVIGLGEYAFANSSRLTSVMIPNTVATIGANAFKDCGYLSSVTIGSSVATIGVSAFENCQALKSVTIPNSVTTIGKSTFYYCSSLASVTIPNTVTKIDDTVFFGCRKLTEIVIPSSVTTIGRQAFDYCSSLATIVMGHGVKSIGEGAFGYSPILQNISITALEPPTASDRLTFGNYKGTLYLCGEDAVLAYKNSAPCWERFAGQAMVEPSHMETDSESIINGNPGDTFQLSVRLMPENVHHPYIFWNSTNPSIASVDNNGLVTLHDDLSKVMALADTDDEPNSCKIIATSLYANGPQMEFTVNNRAVGAAVDIIKDHSGKIDYSAPYEIYNLSGIHVADSRDNLAPGIYIVRQGANTAKLAIQ